MTLFKLTLIAVALFGVSAEADSSTASGVGNKGDLGIGLLNVSTNTEGKGDCDCAESLYSSAAASGFHNGFDEEIRPVIIIPAAAPATAAIISVPIAKAIRKKLRRIASQDGSVSVRRKAGHATAYMFGAPNAKGCRQN